MKRITWDESLSVGVEAIDEQHRRWIDNYNRVAVAIESHAGPAPVTTTLAFLIDYTQTHFDTEKRFMTETKYPGMADHLAKHDELSRTVSNLVADYEEEQETATLQTAVETLLGNWLIDHIESTDQAFGAYVKENGYELKL